MSEHQEPSALRQAEPWLRLKAERLVSILVEDPDLLEDDVRERMIERVLFDLKVAYSEGYADRMKSEVAEVRSETPKRTTRRRKR